MNRRYISIGLLVSSIILMMLHIGALKFYWYWLYWWFDILTHFIGGIVAALVILYLYQFNLSTKLFLNRKKIFLLSVMGAIIVAVLWEIFEVVIRSTGPSEMDYLVDTTTDILTGVSGGAFVYVIIVSLTNGKSKINGK